MKASLVVHGGTWEIPSEQIEAHRVGCKAAVMAGWQVLSTGGHALDAIEAAIRVMEDDPALNAGTGSVLNLEGEVQLDAGLMEGANLQAGAVAALRTIKNPITLARRVLESEYVLIVGEGAVSFASAAGIEECIPEELVVNRQVKLWEAMRADAALGVQRAETVGAVAIDHRGNIAAGNSTGGRPFKPPGRVGDSPLVGCGFYADNALGGAACTGPGEGIIRVVLAHTAVQLLAERERAQQAAELAVQILSEKVGGRGGVIMVDRNGGVGRAFSTAAMGYAYMTEDQDEPIVGV